MPPFDELKALTVRAFREDPVEHHPLFVRLAADDLSVEEARRVGLQILHVVDHFPRLIAAMLVRLDDFRLRMPLVDNLYCEHGRLDPAAAHVETYRAFLRGLSIDDATMSQSEPSVGVIAYNRAVLDLCLHHSVPEALTALGVIEETVARTSPIVSRWAARRRFDRAEGARAHFGEHEVLDLRHADELYALAACYLTEATRADVRRGVALGTYYQRRLYTDLTAAPAA